MLPTGGQHEAAPLAICHPMTDGARSISKGSAQSDFKSEQEHRPDTTADLKSNPLHQPAADLVIL